MTKPYRLKGCKLWYIRYQDPSGRRISESSRSEKVTVARNLLKQRLAEVQLDTYIDRVKRRATVDQLYMALLADYRNNGAAILEGSEQRWNKRLKQHFAGRPAISITTEYLNRYVDWCRDEAGLSNATINRDLAALRRAFRLAVEARQIPSVPKFPRPKEAPPRSGFVEQPQYAALAREATELWLRALLAVAYTFGCHKQELLNLRVRQVDLLNRTIRLNPGETKNGDGRVAVMTQEVYVLIQACVAGKDADDYVLTRDDGKGVKDFRERWAKLVAAAGCENQNLLLHDLRRSAVRNVIRRGIPEVVAMRISGHKTRAVFDRYNIVSEADLVDAARKLEAGEAELKALVESELTAKPEMVKKWSKKPDFDPNQALAMVAENDATAVN